MTGARTVPLADAARALADRAPHADRLAAPFGELEKQAHALLPALATLRPAIGATPLVPVPSAAGRGRVWLKAESANTTGTIKARTAYALLCAAVTAAGGPARLVEYSGGSLAVALSEFCAVAGLDLHMVVPFGTAERLVRALRSQGTRVSSGRAGTGFLGALDEAVRVGERDGRHLLLQHCAAEAVAVHREHTGAEIAAQLAAHGVRPGLLAASVGTGGTVVGVAQALRESWPELRAVAVFPAEAPYADPAPPDGTPRMSGTGGLGYALRQPLVAPYAQQLEFHDVGYPQALAAMRRLHAEQQLAVSASTGGAWLAASHQVDTPGGPTEAVAVLAGRGTIEEWSHARQ